MGVDHKVQQTRDDHLGETTKAMLIPTKKGEVAHFHLGQPPQNLPAPHPPPRSPQFSLPGVLFADHPLVFKTSRAPLKTQKACRHKERKLAELP